MPSQTKKSDKAISVSGAKLIGPIEIFKSAFNVYRENKNSLILNTVLKVCFCFLGLIISVFQIENIFLASSIYVFLLVCSFYFDIQLLLILKNQSKRFWPDFQASAKYFWTYALLYLSLGVVIWLGLLLFVLPGLILMVFFSLVLCTMVFEDLKYWPAIKRGFSLAAKNWFGIFLRFIFLILAFLAFSLVYFIIIFAFSLVCFVIGIPALGSAFYIAFYMIYVFLAMCLSYSFVIIYTTLIYKSLAAKK